MAPGHAAAAQLRAPSRARRGPGQPPDGWPQPSARLRGGPLASAHTHLQKLVRQPDKPQVLPEVAGAGLQQLLRKQRPRRRERRRQQPSRRARRLAECDRRPVGAVEREAVEHGDERQAGREPSAARGGGGLGEELPGGGAGRGAELEARGVQAAQAGEEPGSGGDGGARGRRHASTGRGAVPEASLGGYAVSRP
jgi:hypothetical protein